MPVNQLIFRLRRHADYQRVYKAGRKQFAKQMSYFYAVRTDAEIAADPDGIRGARVGLTVGKVMGKAVDRNRIKRRMREAVRRHIALLVRPVDVILHPRRTVIEMEFAALEREVASVFRAIERMGEASGATLGTTSGTTPRSASEPASGAKVQPGEKTSR